MKKTIVSIFRLLVAVALLGLSIPSVIAASGNWNIDAAGNWSTAGNWNPAAVPGTAAGDVVGLNFDITAARSVTLDTPATVGTLNIGDPASGFFGYALSTATAQTLTFDNSGGGASLNQATVGGAVDTISVPLSLADNLTISCVNGLTLSGAISSPSAINLTKNGAGMLTLSGANTYYSSSITINAGTLYCPVTAAGDGTVSAFGNVSGGGVNIYVNSGATLSSGNNNWFGNATIADSSLPTINVTGGTVAITNNYTTLGTLNLTNGATVTSTGTGGGNYYGFQFRGYVIVGGTTPSTISGSRDYHLNVNTTFDVENTGGSPADLIVSANLRNLSGDFGNGAGSFTKSGPGKMMISGGGNVFSGSATINAGTLQIGDGATSNGSIAGYIDDEATLIFANPTAFTYTNYIVGAGNLVKTGAGTLTLSGTSYYSGATTISNGALSFTSPQSISGSMTVNDGTTLAVTASADTTYLSPSGLTLGNTSGATLQFGLFGTSAAILNPGSVTINGTATINIASCPFVNGASYPLINNYSGGTLVLGSQPGGVLGELVVSGSTVSYSVTNIVFDLWKASVDTNWDTTTANWTNNLGANQFVSGYPASFDDSANGSDPLLVNIGPAAVTPGFISVSNVAKNYIIGGLAISGGANLIKDGAASLTFTGTNTFTGSMTISAGLVAISGAGQLGGGNYSAAIVNNGAFSFNSSANQTLSGVVSGSGSLTNSGPGALTLGTANTYSGGTVLQGGSTVIPNGAVSAFGTGALAISNATIIAKPGNGSSYTSANSIYLGNSVTVAAGSTNTIDNSVNSFGNMWVGGDSSPWTGTGTVKFQNSGGVTRPSVLWCANPLQGFQGTINIGATTSGQSMYVGFGYNSGNGGAGSSVAVFDGSGVAWQMGDVGYSWSQCVDGSCTTIKLGSLSAVNPSTYLRGSPNPLTYEVGALNTDTTFAGQIDNWGATSLRKLGTGTLTLSGANTFTGGLNLDAGVLCVSNASALSASCPIVFGGGTLRYSAANQADYSAQIASSASPMLIDVNGTNVTYVTALPANNTGGLVLTNSSGSGKLTLTAGNLYTGSTLISAGTLALSGSGNIGYSTNITVASGAIFDVSAATYTLGGSQTLSGSGSVTGAVTTTSVGSRITPGGAATVGILTFNGNLDLGSGASPIFDLSTSSVSGNDQIVVGGNLTLNSSDVVHVYALSGSANLDQTADYVLFSVTGIIAAASQPGLQFDGTAPANANHYSIKTNGNTVVLHYSASAAPIITSVLVTNNATGLSVASRGDFVTVYVTVTPGVGTVTNVSANLTSIGGSAAQTLTSLGGNNYSYTLQIGSGAIAGLDTIGVTATDTTPLTGGGSGSITINSATDTWAGLAGDDNWTSGANWVGSVAPGYIGDSAVFTGSTRTTPNMNTNYSMIGLTFNGSASSFTVGSTTGSILTLSGGVTNQSGSAQILNVPIILGSPQIIEDQFGGGITLAGPVSGSALTVDMGVVTLAGTNVYTGNTMISGGTMKVANGAPIPNGSSAGNVSLSATATLDLNGTNATLNGLTGASGAQVINSGVSASTLSVGGNNQNSTWSGTIAGSTSVFLVKIGNGTLTLNSANSHTGGTVLSSGTIIYANASAFGTAGTLTLGTGNLARTASSGDTLNPVNVTGTVNYVATGSGNPGFSGAFTGSGVFIVPNVTVGGVSPGATSIILSGDLSGYTGTFSQTPGNNRLRFGPTAAGSIVINGSNAKFVTSGSTSSGNPIDMGDDSYGTFKMGELSGTGGIIRGGWASAGNTTFEIGALNTSTTYAGAVQDNARGSFGLSGLTKIGTGTLTLTGPNSYTAPTIVSNGTLNISSAKTSSGGFTVADNTTLGVNLLSPGAQLKMTSLTLGGGIGCTNSFTGVSSTTVPAITNSGVLTLAGTVTVNVQGFVNAGQYPLINSAGGITGAGGFVVGVLPVGAVGTIITNSNAIVLNVTTAPTLQIWTGAASGNWDNVTTNWTFASTPVAYTNGYPAKFDDSTSVTNITVITNVSPLSLIVTNETRDYTFIASGTNRITGSTVVNKSGDGKLTLVGMSNDFTGGFAISGGTVVVADSANLGAGAITLNGTLSPSQGFTLARTVNVGPGNGIYNVGSGVTLTNTTAMGGAGVLVKSGTGTLRLGGNSTYSGGTVVSNGTLVLTTGGGAGTIRGALTIQSGAIVSCTAGDALGYNGGQCTTPINIVGGTLDDAIANNQAYITTFNLTGGTMSSSGGGAYNFNGGSSGLNSLAASTVSIVSGPILLRAGGLHINTAPGTVPSGVDLTISGIISGSGLGFQKDGAGTLELTGVNTYNGNTTIAAGQLLVDGAGVIAGSVGVSSGAVFGGNGTASGAVTINAGATLAPGTAAVGTLTLGNNLSLAGNTLVKLNKGNVQSNDFVNVTGTLSYGGTLTVTNIGPALVVGDTFRIFKTGGTGSITVTGNAGTGRGFSFTDGVVSVISTGPSGPATITNSVSGNTLSLTWPAGQNWRLQAQTNSLSVGLTTNGWVDVTATDGSYNATINSTNPTVFYRLVYP